MSNAPVKPIKHVIFDNDGVNIDSETVAIGVLRDFANSIIQQVKPDVDVNAAELGDYKHFAGTSIDEIFNQIIVKHGLPIGEIRDMFGISDLDAVREKYNKTGTNPKTGEAYTDASLLGSVLGEIGTDLTIQAYKDGFNAIFGIEGALKQIDLRIGGMKNRALCTTSPEDRMNVCLESALNPTTGENAGLAELFPDEGNRRISGYGYPNKYEYFETLGHNWDPEETLIVEDSTSGVEKAKAANEAYRVIGTVASDFYEDKGAQAQALMDKGADIVVVSVVDLPAALDWMNTGFDPEKQPRFQAPVYLNDAHKADAVTQLKADANRAADRVDVNKPQA
ncbi:MAG: hypothetical protein HRT94_01850 [Alphaproteobacteria bacterium]|nr:hypothetical protein [Alphaproteobacteria bacterium]